MHQCHSLQKYELQQTEYFSKTAVICSFIFSFSFTPVRKNPHCHRPNLVSIHHVSLSRVEFSVCGLNTVSAGWSLGAHVSLITAQD